MCVCGEVSCICDFVTYVEGCVCVGGGGRIGGGGGPVVATLSLALRMVCVGSSVFVTLGGGLLEGGGGRSCTCYFDFC